MKIDIRPFSGQVSWQRSLPLTIDKALIEQLIERLCDGKPIETPSGGWSANDLFMVAGVCAWAAANKVRDIWSFLYRNEFSALPKEHQEAWGHTLLDNVPAIALFVATAAHHIDSNTYDQKFAPTLDGYIYVEEDAVVFEMKSESGSEDNETS
jgi:hypothetical protein